MTQSDTHDESESERTELAPPGTLLGQLQRGRGAGFLSALTEDPTTVHAHLLHCITHDPRWDTQIESRAEYYARLIHATKMIFSPLDQYLRNTPDERLQYEAGLAVSTLGWLARLGDLQAVSILRDCIWRFRMVSAGYMLAAPHDPPPLPAEEAVRKRLAPD